MSETINFRVPDGTKQPLKDQARKAGYRSLTSYIKAFLSVDSGTIAPSSKLLKATPHGRCSLETTVSLEEKQAFQAMCDTEGVKPAEALRRQVRIAIRNGPDFCKKEQQLLVQSIRQLMAIGRNLNQVTKKINQDGGDISQRLLSDLKLTIEAHHVELTNLVSRSRRRSVE